MAHPAPAGHDDFQEWNVRIQGIRVWKVADAPRWSKQLDRLRVRRRRRPRGSQRRGRPERAPPRLRGDGRRDPPYRSLCSLQVARKVYDLDSYRLPVAAAAVGFGAFPHHDALADARACAQIVIDAARRSGTKSVDELATSLGLRLAAPSAPAAEPTAA